MINNEEHLNTNNMTTAVTGRGETPVMAHMDELGFIPSVTIDVDESSELGVSARDYTDTEDIEDLTRKLEILKSLTDDSDGSGNDGGLRPTIDKNKLKKRRAKAKAAKKSRKNNRGK
jgi:hypothetical protein